MGIQFDFVALLVSVDQMAEKEKEHYRYTMFGVSKLVVVVHVDGFYIIKIRKQIVERNELFTYTVDNDGD